MEYTLTIVLPTLGRTTEVDAMLESIFSYAIDDSIGIEIIIVDQNYSNLLDDIVEKYSNKKYPISHHKVSFRGLSKAKNYGVRHSRGKYVCCIDDDAEFTEGLINRAIRRLECEDMDIISGRCIDREGNNSVLPFKNEESVLTIDAFENRFVESTMFFKREVCERFSYDEEMGVGAFYGAEEGYDLVYRMLHADIKIVFDPQIAFYHPHSVTDHSGQASVRRAYTYRKGYGYLCRKHKLKRKFWKRVLLVFFALPVLACIRPKDVRYYVAEFLGLLVGRYV